MIVLMDREISCKGHCEKLSHFLDHVSHTVLPSSNFIKAYTCVLNIYYPCIISECLVVYNSNVHFCPMNT